MKLKYNVPVESSDIRKIFYFFDDYAEVARIEAVAKALSLKQAGTTRHSPT